MNDMTKSTVKTPFPIEFRRGTWRDVFYVGVDNFSAPHKEVRQALLLAAYSACLDLNQAGLELIIIVDGSYLTPKERPGDIDLFIVASYKDRSTIPKSPEEFYWTHRLRDEQSRKFKVDMTVTLAYGGALLNSPTSKTSASVKVSELIGYTIDHLSTGADGTSPKGGFVIYQ